MYSNGVSKQADTERGGKREAMASVNQEEEVKVLSAGGSPFGWRVMMALREKGVPYQYQEEDLLRGHKSPLLLASNPVHKKVPVLLHRGRPICESPVILEYIDDTWPSPNPLLPQDPYARARTRFWADFANDKLVGAIRRLVEKNKLREDREAATQDFADSYLWLEQAFAELAHGKPYFGGDSIGFLDLVIASLAPWFTVMDLVGPVKLPSHARCPLVGAWRERIVDHPSVKEVIAPFPPKTLIELYGLEAAIVQLDKH